MPSAFSVLSVVSVSFFPLTPSASSLFQARSPSSPFPSFPLTPSASSLFQARSPSSPFPSSPLTPSASSLFQARLPSSPFLSSPLTPSASSPFPARSPSASSLFPTRPRSLSYFLRHALRHAGFHGCRICVYVDIWRHQAKRHHHYQHSCYFSSHTLIIPLFSLFGH